MDDLTSNKVLSRSVRMKSVDNGILSDIKKWLEIVRSKRGDCFYTKANWTWRWCLATMRVSKPEPQSKREGNKTYRNAAKARFVHALAVLPVLTYTFKVTASTFKTFAISNLILKLFTSLYNKLIANVFIGTFQ